MNKTLIRKRVTTLLLLMLFVLSVTPKLYLHYLVANHKDSSFTIGAKETLVAKKGIHCDCNSLVVVAPFVQESSFIQLSSSPFFITHDCRLCNYFYSLNTHVSGLRGPPSLDI